MIQIFDSPFVPDRGHIYRDNFMEQVCHELVRKRSDTYLGVASFLCRSTNPSEVEAKARELGLPVRHD
jgi:hypothetical protein